MNWLTDQPTFAYYVPAVAAIGFLLAYLTTRKKLHLFLMLGMAALVGAVWLIDYFVVTDREQVEESTREILAGADTKDMERIKKHLSPQFESGGVKYLAVVEEGSRYLRSINAVTVKSIDVTRGGDDSFESRCQILLSGDIGFGGGNNTPWQVRFHYRKDDDGVWRVRSLEVYDGLGQTRYWPR
jgi:hypothetical protein